MPESSPLPNPASIRAAILASSPVTLMGLTCPNEALQERCAEQLVDEIMEQLKVDRAQLRLAL